MVTTTLEKTQLSLPIILTDLIDALKPDHSRFSSKKCFKGITTVSASLFIDIQSLLAGKSRLNSMRIVAIFYDILTIVIMEQSMEMDRWTGGGG